MKYNRKFLVLSMLLLFVGFLLYFTRIDCNYIWGLFNPSCISLKLQNKISLNNFIVYNLPDGLWCSSAIFLLAYIWVNSTKWFLFYSVVFSLISFFYELLQKYHIIPGTFDITDIITMMVCIAFSCSIIMLQKKLFRY